MNCLLPIRVRSGGEGLAALRPRARPGAARCRILRIGHFTSTRHCGSARPIRSAWQSLTSRCAAHDSTTCATSRRRPPRSRPWRRRPSRSASMVASMAAGSASFMEPLPPNSHERSDRAVDATSPRGSGQPAGARSVAPSAGDTALRPSATEDSLPVGQPAPLSDRETTDPHRALAKPTNLDIHKSVSNGSQFADQLHRAHARDVEVLRPEPVLLGLGGDGKPVARAGHGGRKVTPPRTGSSRARRWRPCIGVRVVGPGSSRPARADRLATSMLQAPYP